METDTRQPVKGIRIRTLNLAMIIISCALYILLIWATIHAWQQYEAMVAAINDYTECEQDASLITDGSNYLTEQVRLYTVTGNVQYVEKYFTEAHVSKRRDAALHRLETFRAGEKGNDYFKTALDHSNQLMEQEFYAMKLVAAAQGDVFPDYPEVQELSLLAEDQNLSPEKKIKRAQDIVFGSDYQDAKEAIISNVRYFLNDIIAETQQKQEDSSVNLRRTMNRQHVLISLLFMENILFFILVIRLIIKPLRLYIRNIKEEQRLEITGSYEFKYLAFTYNNIFELNAASESTLRHQAEHDPLTGIMNRGAFDHLRQILKAKPEPFALLIIDVDKFKLVNDGYGHDTGDKVLQKVALLLEDSFRSSDFPARIGGDEFAVIITDMTPDLKTVIENKVKEMNDFLLHPTDGLPKVSLSVGAAFSECGFSEDLYKKADIALYAVKEHGRCGCRFYEEPKAE